MHFKPERAVAPRDRSATHFLGFNQSDDANRMQDIVTALAFPAGTRRESDGQRPIELIGIGPRVRVVLVCGRRYTGSGEVRWHA